jgi:hypothetical protein
MYSSIHWEAVTVSLCRSQGHRVQVRDTVLSTERPQCWIVMAKSQSLGPLGLKSNRAKLILAALSSLVRLLHNDKGMSSLLLMITRRRPVKSLHAARPWKNHGVGPVRYDVRWRMQFLLPANGPALDVASVACCSRAHRCTAEAGLRQLNEPKGGVLDFAHDTRTSNADNLSRRVRDRSVYWSLVEAGCG